MELCRSIGVQREYCLSYVSGQLQGFIIQMLAAKHQRKSFSEYEATSVLEGDHILSLPKQRDLPVFHQGR